MNEHEKQERQLASPLSQSRLGPWPAEMHRGVAAGLSEPTLTPRWRPVITEGWIASRVSSENIGQTHRGKEIILSRFPSPQTSGRLLSLPVTST